MKETLLDKCREASSIVIYGAGTIADILYIYLKQNKMHHNVTTFVVTKLGGNVARKFGLDVVELSECVSKLQEAFVIVAVQHFIQDEIEKLLELNEIHNYYCVDSELLLHRFYEKLYCESICDNKILFQNQSGVGYGGNPKYIAEKLLEKDINRELDLIWAVSEYKAIFPKRIRQVLYGSEEYYNELATAKIWVDNSRKAYSVKKREGQFYIQAWHGAAPIKKVEADVEDVLPPYYIMSAKNDSIMADVFLSGSEFYTKLYRKSFWYNGEILKFGLPRHDIFWNTDLARNKVYDYYGINKEVSVVLYAPTFRDQYMKECYDLEINRTVKALESRFGRKFVMMVSRHPVNYYEYSFERGANYIDVGDYDDFQELLATADVLISDYSGCMYDFSFTEKPIFLYQRDIDEYMHDRNFYIPMEELPYIKVHSNEELEKAIEQFDMDKYVKKLRVFMGSMNNYDTGNASEQVVQYIRKHVLNF